MGLSAPEGFPCRGDNPKPAGRAPPGALLYVQAAPADNVLDGRTRNAGFAPGFSTQAIFVLFS
jgi:hypothetical protein